MTKKDKIIATSVRHAVLAQSPSTFFATISAVLWYL